MRVHYLQHVAFEDLGLINTWVEKKSFRLSVSHLYQGDALPAHDDYDILIILGGPMSVHDEALYDWLVEEKQFIRDAIDKGKYVLGICLGAQLIAQTLGAQVTRLNHREIGWHPMAFTDNSVGQPLTSGLNLAMTVFQWHGETFGIPAGASLLASSPACQNQGFSYGKRVLALQCHLEMDEPTINGLIENCGDQLVDAPYTQSQQEIVQGLKEYDLSRPLFRLLDNWLSAGR